MKKEKNTYITPLLTVVEFKTERGYAQSENLVMNASMRINEFVDQEMEIQLADVDSRGHNEVLAGNLGENVDQASGGSAWQYSNGSWF